MGYDRIDQPDIENSRRRKMFVENFRVRTITFFLTLADNDFSNSAQLDSKVKASADFLRKAQQTIEAVGYQVQTTRIATTPFPNWIDEDLRHIHILDSMLAKHNIEFCSLGPADTPNEISLCHDIIQSSSRFSCSANLRNNDVPTAAACAELVKSLATVRDGNFRFCVASDVKPGIPFFPAAKAGCSDSFAIGLENGALARDLLLKCESIENITPVFRDGMNDALKPLQEVCRSLSYEHKVPFVGIDTSLNPSLSTEETGSVAAAIESLNEVSTFGNVGTLAAAAAITQSLQSLPDIPNCGYSGLMLPVCEDRRLAELDDLNISNLLSISQVCGVGVDTVPVPGNVSVSQLKSLFLDVAAMAYRWDKPLSCRVFPVEGSEAGQMTEFDSPYLVNAKVFNL